MLAKTTFATAVVLLSLAAGIPSAAGARPAAPATSASADQSVDFVIGNLQPAPANLTVKFNGGVALHLASAGELHYACPPTVIDCTVVTGNRIDLPAGQGIDEIVKRDQVTCPVRSAGGVQLFDRGRRVSIAGD
jgi:hypothetical protein